MDPDGDSYSTNTSPTKLVEELCKSFLDVRTNTISRNIVDVADEEEVGRIRALAIPQANGQPFEKNRRRHAPRYVSSSGNGRPQIFWLRTFPGP